VFYWLLLGVSVSPYLIFPIAFAGKSPPNTEMVRQTILFLANAHIANGAPRMCQKTTDSAKANLTSPISDPLALNVSPQRLSEQS
jgi:hypothetical protein